jgi:oxygen-independent coproporphyrinogen-3 oxidase
MAKKKKLSIYVHIPFCRTRCGYCDFNTYAGLQALIPAYVRALDSEIVHFGQQLQEEYFVHTIYFGGGTPSLLSANNIHTLISEVKKQFTIASDAEISMEANPNGITFAYLDEIRKIGINRISFGMQSAIAKELAVLDRKHTNTDVEMAVAFAKEAGIAQINLDLMFGIPLQSMQSLEASIKYAILLEPQHLSVYGLSLHEGTTLAKKISTGAIEPIDEDLAGDMYAWLMECLPEMGYSQYEISNWTAPGGRPSVHNLQYWLNLDYVGIGAGAHSYVETNRWSNRVGIQAYIEGITSINREVFFHTAVAERNALSSSDIIKETMMMGLRLTQTGVNISDFEKRFSVDVETFYEEEISRLLRLGLVEFYGDGGTRCLRLTTQGRMLGNQVFLEFI